MRRRRCGRLRNRGEVNPIRRQVHLLTALAALVALLFVGGLWTLYTRSQEVLEAELGARLRTVAAASAAVVPADSLMAWSDELSRDRPGLKLMRRLRSMQRENDLSRIVVFNARREVVYDSASLLGAGERFLFLSEEREVVDRALTGEAMAAPLRREGEVWLKAAYAPVFYGSSDFLVTLDNLKNKGMLDDVGRVDFVAGFVGVFAHPSFFVQLQLLRRSLIVVGTVVLTLLILLATGMSVYARRLELARAALLRSETLSSMGRMAAGIAHEIRNPLGVIKNSAQLLREELVEAALDTEIIDFIPSEIDRLNETLTGYLEFAKEAPLRLESVEVAQLLRRTTKMLGPELDRAGVRVEHNLDSCEKLRITADPRRLQQVFLNLMLNSMQSMDEGGRMQLSIEFEDDTCKIRVKDEGSGIEASRLREIFEPFHTTREKGSGLGLFIVGRIVEEHGGSISVESAPGEGTSITVQLPRVEIETRGQ
jgi:signal transduction histidine kinase